MLFDLWYNNFKKRKPTVSFRNKKFAEEKALFFIEWSLFYDIISSVSSAKLTNKWDSWEVVKMNWDFTILVAIVILFLIISKK